MKKRCVENIAHFGPLMGYCDHQVQKLMVRKLRQYDVTPMQCRTLTYLHDAEQEVNQKMLENYLLVKPSTVNGIVGRLEEKKFLTRQSSCSDGRCRIVTLTDRGRQFYDDLCAVMREVNIRLEQGFTQEELATLKQFLLRIAQNLTEEDEK